MTIRDAAQNLEPRVSTKLRGVRGTGGGPKSQWGLKAFILNGVALSVLLSISPQTVLAQSTLDQKISLDVAPNTDLDEALIAWGRAVGMTVMIDTATAAHKVTNGIHGTHSARDVLSQLLRDSGLTYSQNGQIIRVTPTSSMVRSANFGAPEVDTISDGPEDTQSSAATAEEESTEAKRKTSRNDELDEVVVTGTHIAGTGPVGSDLTVYTRTDIDQSGAGTIDEFARQMTENFSSVDTVANAVSNARFATLSDSTSANVFQGSSFNLHGLGPTATLTLLNGNRIAAAGSDGSFTDMSQIPLSAIDRIEVLSDGASAIYGADAVAGVVNVITRKDLEGAESTLRYGVATDGGALDRLASQLMGHSWSSGSAFLSYEYDDQGGLDASERSYIPNLGGPYSLIPESHRNSVLLAGTQSLGTTTTITGNALYSDRDFLSEDTQNSSYYDEGDFNSGHAKQLSAALSLEQGIFEDWVVKVGGNYSNMRQLLGTVSNITGGFTANVNSNETADSKLSDIGALASGSLAQLPGGALKASVGADFRSEQFDSAVVTDFAGEISASTVPNLQRHVRSVYGEVFVPIIESDNSIAGVRRLEASIAGRYDDYTDFGSSRNPKFGLMWEPIAGFDIRGSYGRSFRAPLLSQIGSTPIVSTSPIADPASPTGVSDTVVVEGGNPSLRPETSRSFTGGFDLKPASLPGATVSMNFFHINFTNRVSLPPTTTGAVFELSDPALAPFVTRNPPLSEVLSYFSKPGFVDAVGLGPSAVQAILLEEYANIGTSVESGLDLNAKYVTSVGPGKLNFSLAIDHLLQDKFQTVYTQPFISVLNNFGDPTKWKGRWGAGWSQGGFTGSAFVNYVNSYPNQLFTPSQRIGAFTTGNLFFSYKTDGTGTSLLRNLTVSLSVDNVTNEKPPYAQIPQVDLNPGQLVIPFDPGNASPVGRLVSLAVSKRWGGRN